MQRGTLECIERVHEEEVMVQPQGLTWGRCLGHVAGTFAATATMPRQAHDEPQQKSKRNGIENVLV